MTTTPGSLDALLDLARSGFYGVQDNDDPGAAHSFDCDYEWMISNREGRLRIDGLALALHPDPTAALADAVALRDAVLALGFTEQYRCEVSAVRVEDIETTTTPSAGEAASTLDYGSSPATNQQDLRT